jgi:tetratricopeptide (TPR) repeat protein
VEASPATVDADAAGSRHRGIPLTRSHGRIAAAIGLALGSVALIGVAIYAGSVWHTRGTADNSQPTPVIAVGRIADYRTGAHAELARPLADMLATNLARSRELRVVSTGRLYELMRQMKSVNDSTGGSHVQAARQAGATRILDGALYSVEGGDLRLDLRLVDLRDGNVTGAYSIRGADAFALADSGTAQLLTDVGATPPKGSLADVTTRSVTAYRLYEEGLRHLASEDSSSAERLFESALAEDSTFAMAAFYRGKASQTNRLRVERMRRAQQLAGRATDRERLIIRAGWAHQNDEPQLAAIAETLAVRYPDEVEGHLYAGVSAVQEGRFEQGLRYLNRVVGMDSLGLQTATAGCAACEALEWIVTAYQFMDSIPNAVREARRWVRLQPRSPNAWRRLGEVLDANGQLDEALTAIQTAVALGSPPDGGLLDLAVHHMRNGQYADAEPLLRQLTLSGVPGVRGDGHWFLAISLRHRGRLTEALDAARAFRHLQREFDPFKRVVTVNALGEGQVLFELGRYAAAAELFDSISRISPDSDLASARARNRGWALTHVATARAAMGDTLSLRWLADSVGALGALTGRGRDRQLHHHIRGLLWIARGDSSRAISELRSAIYSPTLGYTRTNYELGKVYLGVDRPRDAVAVLGPAIRGAMEASNLYITRTELHELLAQAHERAGARDSAAAHYAAVVDAWREGEPQFTARWNAARARLAALQNR